MTKRQHQDQKHRQAVEAYYATQDETLLGPVLAELRPRLNAYLRTRGLRDAETRDDIIQDTLAYVVRGLRSSQYAFKGSVASWTMLICSNAYGQWLRRKTTHFTKPGPGEDPFLLLGASASESAVVLSENKEAEQQAGTLLTAATQVVLNLDANARACVVLTFYHGLPVPAAAAQLGIPESTFRTRLSRAIEELQAWGQTVTAPTSEVFDALRRVNTGDLFRETPQPPF